MILIKKYNNGVERCFTVLSFVHDQDNNAAIITTEECGDVSISAADNPCVWPQFIDQLDEIA